MVSQIWKFYFIRIAKFYKNLFNLDGFSSAPSPCALVNSPEPNYPRGIVNPNYPGFQHLAHTLSEYFIEPPAGNISDSDTSDFEYDLSVEKQLESFKNSYRLDNQNNNDYYNNRNSKNNNYDEGNFNQNQNIDNSNFNHSDGITNLCRVEAMLKNALESPSTELPPPMDDAEDDVDFLLLENESNTHQDPVVEQSNDQKLNTEKLQTETDKYSQENQTEIIACDLQTYLKRYNETGRYIKFNKKLSMTKSPSCPNEPPDILAKSIDILPKITLDTVTVKPDILQMVDSASENNQKHTESVSCYDFEYSNKDSNSENRAEDKPESRIIEKDDHGQWSITPVDIVGNFEQEVHREFGLLMSGYKNSSSSSRASETNGYVSSSIHEKVRYIFN